eukprot:CAMPEP_0117679966 /NCGR_PEP_ID=MMETSP0804-20121206/18088_1 /TAXON_ID=1074897 /ORGANISM="Tetraselmis astigmatica, Strain CCMP880" /LENGTH=86 /DNA_ID=CAMNT_0005489407 /DNA_START=806 /DNA_END=1066 /DNA_ORIENTATION=-
MEQGPIHLSVGVGSDHAEVGLANDSGAEQLVAIQHSIGGFWGDLVLDDVEKAVHEVSRVACTGEGLGGSRRDADAATHIEVSESSE